MALTDKQKELVAFLKTKEGQEAIRGTKDDQEELTEILKEIDITDDDDIQSVSKKHQAQIKKLVTYFGKQVANAKKDAVDEATKDSRAAEDAKIRAFAAKNPGMKNDKVLAMMQPLYDKGESLEDAYAIACRGIGLDPKTGEAPDDKGGKKDDDDKGGKQAKSSDDDKGGKRSSAKSGMNHDDDDDGGDDKGGKKEPPKSLQDALAANSSEYIAKHGNPFDRKE